MTDFFEGALFVFMAIVVLVSSRVGLSLAEWLDARTITEKLLHTQVKAGEEAITQFSGALHQIASKHKAKSGN